MKWLHGLLNWMNWRHNLPLILFTLVMPAMVLGYYLGAPVSTAFLILILLVSAAILALTSSHLGRPGGAPRAVVHVKLSWLSREMLFFGLFLVGICLQIVFPSLRVREADYVIFFIGVFGIIATIMVYRGTPRMKGWPVYSDFLLEGFFLASLLRPGPWLIAALLLKGAKDALLSLLFYPKEKQRFWFVTGVVGFVVLAGGSFVPGLTANLAVINSLILRIIFFHRVERDYVTATVQEVRKSYLPEEYQKYFERK